MEQETFNKNKLVEPSAGSLAVCISITHGYNARFWNWNERHGPRDCRNSPPYFLLTIANSVPGMSVKRLSELLTQIWVVS
jgi:hypothetical protein